MLGSFRRVTPAHTILSKYLHTVHRYPFPEESQSTNLFSFALPPIIPIVAFHYYA